MKTTKANKTSKTAVSLAKVDAPKNAIVASEKTAVKVPAVKAEPKPKVGKYGAPAQRPSRTTNTHSEFGNRKWIFRGVTVYDAKNNQATTDATQCTGFEKSVAENMLAKLLERKDVVNGRLFYKKSENPDIQMRSVWIAFASENGMTEKAA